MYTSVGRRRVDTPRRVFVIWLGGPLPPTRAASLVTIRRNVGVETVVVTEDTIASWITADDPLHPSFGRLSAVHQADYLRCYLMHHHGGGYVDLKPVTSDWRPAFDQLDGTPGALAVGYREVGPGFVATLGTELLHRPRWVHAAWWRRAWLQLNHRRLIGNGAFVFQPRSPLTREWFDAVTRQLDGYAPRLANHPARHPRDHAGPATEGRPEGYPVPWTALLGDVLHPLTLRYRRRILRTLVPPAFEGYQ